MKKFILVLLFLLSRALDMLTTFEINGGNLSHETSPIISWFGLGWESMVVYNLIISVIIVFLIIKMNDKKIVMSEKAMQKNSKSFKEYVFFLFYKKQPTFREILISRHFDYALYMQIFIPSLIASIITLGLVATANNILAFYSYSIIKNIPLQMVIHLIVLFLVVLMGAIQLSYLYKRYKKCLNEII
jgi:hypothetical protein